MPSLPVPNLALSWEVYYSCSGLDSSRTAINAGKVKARDSPYRDRGFSSGVSTPSLSLLIIAANLVPIGRTCPIGLILKSLTLSHSQQRSGKNCRRIHFKFDSSERKTPSVFSWAHFPPVSPKILSSHFSIDRQLVIQDRKRFYKWCS